MLLKAIRIQIKNSENQIKENVGMRVYCCSCGAKILIVPDLSEMDKAIKKHLILHKKITGQRLSEEIFIQGILETIAEQES